MQTPQFLIIPSLYVLHPPCHITGHFMFGNNPVRTPVKGDGLTLDIQHIFATLQGEGIYAGHPAVFIRLGGCNLACSFCDTEFESSSSLGLLQIVEKVIALSDKKRKKLIVITGGEPFLQPIAPLCSALLSKGFNVQIETNGTLYRELPEAVEIICSPKNNGAGYFPVRPDLLARITAFKFIISAHHPAYSHVPDIGQESIPVYVQPMDEYDESKNKANLILATQLACNYGYRLSLQLHKIIGLE